MAYPYRLFQQPNIARPVLHPELGQRAGRFHLLSEIDKVSETMYLIIAGRDQPSYRPIPLQQSLPRRASASLVAKNTCRHIAVGSAFDHL